MPRGSELMEIRFEQRRLEKIFKSKLTLTRKFGSKIATGTHRRMRDLRIAGNLDEVSYLPPQRLHALIGKYSGYFAIDVTQNVRLIFRGVDAENNMSLEKSKIVGIIIKEVIDYHDK